MESPDSKTDPGTPAPRAPHSQDVPVVQDPARLGRSNGS